MCTSTVPFDDQFEVLNKQVPTLVDNFSIFNNLLSGLLEKEAYNRFDLIQIEIELNLIEQKLKLKSNNIHDGILIIKLSMRYLTISAILLCSV